MSFEKNCPPPPKGLIGPRIARAARLIRRRFNHVLSEEGLFSGQQHIIFQLMENEGMTVSEIAKKIGITAATASVSVKRMEKAGFVEKKTDKSDARITKLYLTQKGCNVHENIKNKMDAQDRSLVENMSEQEILMLSDLLDRAILNLEKEDSYD